jgi:hypothetical protein
MNIRSASLCLVLTFSTAAGGAELGPEHQRLASFAGRWSVKQSMWAGQKNPPKIDMGSATYTLVLGGRHLRQDLHIDSPTQPFDGLGYIGFDDVTGTHYSTWMDVNFTGIIVANGNYDAANKTYTFRAEKLREVLHVVDDDHFRFEYFETRDGKESLAVRLEYTRNRPN